MSNNIYDFIKSRVNIVDVIESFSNITLVNIGGGSYRGHHTAHDSDSKQSCHINEIEGVYYCHNCKKGGSSLDYVVSLNEGMSLYEATILIAEKFNIDLYNQGWSKKQQDDYRDKQQSIQSVEKCFVDAINFYHSQLKDRRSYFHSRGINDDTINRLKLGYAPQDWIILEKFLAAQGHTKETMVSTGMVYQKTPKGKLLPYFYDRYIFPYFKNSRPCYASGRDASEYGYYRDRATGKDIEVAKYIKLKMSDSIDKDVIQNQLWGINRLRSPKRVIRSSVNVKQVNRDNGTGKAVIHETIKADQPPKIIVAEGIIDAILCYQELSKYGWFTISPTTSEMSSEDLHDIVDLLEEMPRCQIVFCFDTDEAGKTGAWKSAKHCSDAIYYRLAIKYFHKVLNLMIDPVNIDEQLKIIATKQKEFTEMNEWIMKRIPYIKISIIPKPDDVDKIDLSDMFMMDKTNEVLYWVEAARTVKQYELMLDYNPIRFFKGEKKFEPKSMSDELCTSGRVFYSVRDEIYEYNKGVFDECEVTVRRDINLYLKNLRTSTINNEVVQDIKNTYGIEDVDIFMQNDIINFRNGLVAVTSEAQDFISSIPTSKHVDKVLYSHTPDIPMICQVPIDYNHQSECPNIDQFISEVVRKEDFSILYELVGYCMHASTDMEKAFILIGEGSNGKSTYLKLVERLLGKKNISHISIQDLDDSRFKYAEIFGKLANIYADIPITPLAKVDRFNSIVTGDTIQAERKGKHPFDFTPYSTLIFSCNAIPRSHTKTKGYYRRIVPIRFPFTFGTGEDVDKEREHQTSLIDRLATEQELQGFARKSLKYYAEAVKTGVFSVSGSSLIEMDIYRETNQPEIEFLKDDMYCLLGSDSSGKPYVVAVKELYGAYKEWLDELNPRLKPVSLNEFNKSVDQEVPNIEKYKTRIKGVNTTAYKGIGLVELKIEDEMSDGISL